MQSTSKSTSKSSSSSSSSPVRKLFKYEVLYSKKQLSMSKKKKKGLSQLDGILSIEPPPPTSTSLVTLLPLQEEEEEEEEDVSSTCSSSSCESEDERSEDEKQSFKQKMKKMRQKFKKKNKKKSKSSVGKCNGGGSGGGKKNHQKSAKKVSTPKFVYSAVNAAVSKAAMEKGGLDDDDIVVLSQWECQIVRAIDTDNDMNITIAKKSTVTIATNSNQMNRHKNASSTGMVNSTKNKLLRNTSSSVMKRNNPTNPAQKSILLKHKHKPGTVKRGFNTVANSRTNRLPTTRTDGSVSSSKNYSSSTENTKSALPLKRKLPPQPMRSKTRPLVSLSQQKRKPPVQPIRKKHSCSDDDDEEEGKDPSSINHLTTTSSSSTTTCTRAPLSKSKKLKTVSSSIHSFSRSSSSSSARGGGAVVSNNSSSLFFSGAIGPIQAPNSIKSILRSHQIKGIVFLWNCLTGVSPDLQKVWKSRPCHVEKDDEDGDDHQHEMDEESEEGQCSGINGSFPPSYGAILADEMGLGKTLMTITVLFALYRRNRNDRFVVVCPSSLVSNWAKEFDKWVGKASQPKRIVIRKGGEEGLQMIKSFVPIKPQKSEILIISYDLFRINGTILSQSKNIGLLVVDEGHRLKNTSGSLTLSALQSLNCKARLVITGTPVQNNLSEFYTVVNFVNPGILGDLKSFRRVYERPISAANNKRATQFQKEEGQRVSNELDSITSTFMIRRLQKDVLRSLIPPRCEFLLFCRPTQLQCNLYKELTAHSSAMSDPLPLLTKLRKICTHPALLNTPSKDHSSTLSDVDSNSSGKLDILEHLLEAIYNNTNDKVVVVSNFTSALSLIEEAIIKKRGWPCLRLDGSVEQSSRQPLVDSFNRGSVEHSFIFLLSSKAGGCGLNLCKANRLVMVDGDWNPATDLQAMARIYRQGQKKHSFIYRLHTSGTVEEVIYQRQIQKNNLASFSVDSKTSLRTGAKSKSTRFTPEELRDCFTLKEDCDCDTKNKIGAGWLNYAGPKSLHRQNCYDVPLIELATNKPSELAFVHIVPVVGNDQTMNLLDDDDNEDSAEDYNSLLDSSSEEEEAEFL